ncbi:hypothetical protein FRC18_001005 [Serendipita sp. 400]|nr:hypothetical protein FRC18_001005 [Serendipita sp. 400]
MRLSFASAVFFLTVAAPVLTAPVPSPLSDTTVSKVCLSFQRVARPGLTSLIALLKQAILAKRSPGEGVHEALHLAGKAAEFAFPEARVAKLAIEAVEEHQHHRN